MLAPSGLLIDRYRGVSSRSGEDVAHHGADHSAQILCRHVDEGVAGQEQSPDDRTESTRHAYAVAHGDGLVGQGLTEPVLEIVVLGVVPDAVQLPQRGPVAVLQHEEAPVVDHLLDKPVEQPGRLRRCRVGRHRCNRGRH